ncbi:hypothetical protein GCM10011375_32490 [Hymenobacter qilianensis]|uniref:Uncharacterized protein n=2 Tax=Hymenobacter qilianensis TaxID=1385715 RepID=A0ACB5PV64_9BACT|nr:hypothetical protein [Hymenobacter qilianensis]QNP51468.1 hypothetical protein H9L05_15775 [Hymenobacter qilianensis]GGF74926.1 hypothetical protein GCM10011375_32490 [Hymenobacter qilianensis]
MLSSIIGTIATDYERQGTRPSKKCPAAAASTGKISQQLAAVYPTIARARQMGTTLWWQQDKGRLPAIVASAEITLCYQLLRRFEKTPPGRYPGSRRAAPRAAAMGAYQRGGNGFILPVEALRIVQDPAGTVEQLLVGQSKVDTG